MQCFRNDTYSTINSFIVCGGGKGGSPPVYSVRKFARQTEGLSVNESKCKLVGSFQPVKTMSSETQRHSSKRNEPGKDCYIVR